MVLVLLKNSGFMVSTILLILLPVKIQSKDLDYSLSLREKCPYSELFWSGCGIMRTRITSNTDTFHAVYCIVRNFQFGFCLLKCITKAELKILINFSWYLKWTIISLWSSLRLNALRKKCPNTEYFLVRILPYLDWIRRFSSWIEYCCILGRKWV